MQKPSKKSPKPLKKSENPSKIAKIAPKREIPKKSSAEVLNIPRFS